MSLKKLEFTIDIAAPAEAVWLALWEDATYRRWTSAFGAESHAISDWKEGSPIQFLGDANSGMAAVIERLIPNVQMTFRHQGEIKEGQLVVAPPQSEGGWANAEESYFLSSNGSGTRLDVVLESLEAWSGFMEESFPKALAILKDIAEGR